MFESRILCTNIIETDGKYIFSMWDKNGICILNPSDGKCNVIGIYTNRAYGDNCLTGEVVKAEGKVFFAPFRAEDILIYDINSKNLIDIPLRDVLADDEALFEMEYKFWNVISENGFVYMLGYQSPVILKIDARTLEVSYFTNWAETAPGISKYRRNDNWWFYFGKGHIKVGGVTYVAAGIGNGVWKIDLRNDSFVYVQLDVDTDGFYSIGKFGKDIVLTSSNRNENKLFYWNTETTEIRSEQLPISCLWLEPLEFMENLWLFPFSVDGEILMQSKNGKFIKYGILDKLLDVDYGERDSVLTLKIVNDHTVSFLCGRERKWFTYDYLSDDLKENIHEISDKKYMENYRSELFDIRFRNAEDKHEILNEIEMPLTEFLKRL